MDAQYHDGRAIPQTPPAGDEHPAGGAPTWGEEFEQIWREVVAEGRAEARQREEAEDVERE